MPRVTGTAPAYDNIVNVTDEVRIGKRTTTQGGNWYLVKVGNRFPRLSLRTTDRRQAIALALKAYQAWLIDLDGDWRGIGGMTAHHVGFKKAAEEWLATQTRDAGYKGDVIRKFLNPFFHGERSVTNMAMINDAMIEDYKVWRRTFWLTAAADVDRAKAVRINVAHGAKNFEEPSENTLNREYPTLRQILAYARRRGYMGTLPEPKVPAESGTINRRPAFLGGDFDRLMAEADKWIGEAETDDLRMRRQLLEDWIYVLRYTGLRPPHETDRLQWNGVDLQGTNNHVAALKAAGREIQPHRISRVGFQPAKHVDRRRRRIEREAIALDLIAAAVAQEHGRGEISHHHGRQRLTLRSGHKFPRAAFRWAAISRCSLARTGGHLTPMPFI
jgi:hypothetical protein